MKLNPNSTQPQIFKEYVHPWYEYNNDENIEAKLIRPKPPSKESVKRAKFIDKTYVWRGGDDSIRPRNKRSSK